MGFLRALRAIFLFPKALLRDVCRLFNRYSHAERLSRLLTVLRAHQVAEFSDGEVKIVLRELAPVGGGMETRTGPADRPLTDDQLLYGVDGYGLPDGTS